MHSHVKVINHNMHGYIPPSQPSPRQMQYSPRTTVLYPPTSQRAGSVNSNFSNEQYTPLPRADIKPYHESYFTDVKPPPTIDNDPGVRNNFVAEGLAASLQARVLSGAQIKEEVEMMYERRALQNSNNSTPMVEDVQEQVRVRKCNEEGKSSFYINVCLGGLKLCCFVSSFRGGTYFFLSKIALY